MIDIKSRIKSPSFWASIILAFFIPILSGLGMQWENVTSWGKLISLISDGFKNPVIVVSIIVSLWNAFNNPTTKYISDKGNNNE